MENTVRILELVGLPGSGKTTLSKLQNSRHKFNSTSILSSNQARYLAVKELLIKSDPRYKILRLIPKILLSRFIFSIYKYKGLDDMLFCNSIKLNNNFYKYINSLPYEIFKDSRQRSILNKWTKELFTDYHLIKNYTPGNKIVIFDEGFMNRILSFFGYNENKNNPKLVQDYIRFAPIPDLVHFLECKPIHAFARINERGLPQRMKCLTKEEIIAILNRCNEQINLIKYILRKKKIIFNTTDTSFKKEDVKLAFRNYLSEIDKYTK